MEYSTNLGIYGSTGSVKREEASEKSRDQITYVSPGQSQPGTASRHEANRCASRWFLKCLMVGDSAW